MSDFIKREDAIDIVKNLKRFSCFGDDGFVEIPMVYCELMKVAPADVAPVVRCKDCTYYCPLDDSRPYDCLRSGMLCVRKDDFCSCGKERR